LEKIHSVLIVDDNPILRKELRSILTPQQEFEVSGEAGDGLEAIDSVKKLHPDLILMDLSMPLMSGLAATKEIKRQWPGTKILVFTIHKSPEYRTAALNAGADGYISKDSPRVELIQSIHDALDGKQGLLKL
jgi:DNA-binding NarL/FixJ family response regulator